MPSATSLDPTRTRYAQGPLLPTACPRTRRLTPHVAPACATIFPSEVFIPDIIRPQSFRGDSPPFQPDRCFFMSRLGLATIVLMGVWTGVLAPVAAQSSTSIDQFDLILVGDRL